MPVYTLRKTQLGVASLAIGYTLLGTSSASAEDVSVFPESSDIPVEVPQPEVVTDAAETSVFPPVEETPATVQKTQVRERAVSETSKPKVSKQDTSSPIAVENVDIEEENPFIRSVAPYATKASREDNLYTSVMIAQSILESGWGESTLASAPNHNLFGIKGDYQGSSVLLPTQEYLDGKWVTVKDAFRKYPSYYGSFKDNAQLLRNGVSWNKTIYKGTWREVAKTYQDATKALTGVYATDPNYHTKLNRIIQQFNLTRYDQDDTSYEERYIVQSGDYLYKIAKQYNTTVRAIKSANHLTSSRLFQGQSLVLPTGSQKKETKPAKVKKETNKETYTVAPGDTLWAIAKKHNLSVDQLKLTNQLTSNIIYAGQSLNLKPIKEVHASRKSPYELDVPFLSQHDPRWAYHRYGNDASRTIKENGCAIVSLAMIDSYFKGSLTSPATIADWAGLDHYVYGAGTAWSAFPAFAKSQGYHITNHGRNVSSALRAVGDGEVGLVSLRPGYFINGGHLSVIRGYNPNTQEVFINDPYDYDGRGKNNTRKGHALYHLVNDTSNIWTYRKA